MRLRAIAKVSRVRLICRRMATFEPLPKQGSTVSALKPVAPARQSASTAIVGFGSNLLIS